METRHTAAVQVFLLGSLPLNFDPLLLVPTFVSKYMCEEPTDVLMVFKEGFSYPCCPQIMLRLCSEMLQEYCPLSMSMMFLCGCEIVWQEYWALLVKIKPEPDHTSQPVTTLMRCVSNMHLAAQKFFGLPFASFTLHTFVFMWKLTHWARVSSVFHYLYPALLQAVG